MQVLEYAGGETLQHHIGPLAQAQHKLPSLRLADIERDAAFAGVEIVIAHRSLGASLSVLERTKSADRVDAPGALHFDHIGAEVGERASADRTDHDPAQVEDVYASEW